MLQEFDLRNTPSLEESVRHSDVVYNLIGRNYPTKLVSILLPWHNSLKGDIGTLLSRMFMSRERNALLMQLQNTMLIDSFMSPPTMPTLNRRQNFLDPRCYIS